MAIIPLTLEVLGPLWHFGRETKHRQVLSFLAPILPWRHDSPAMWRGLPPTSKAAGCLLPGGPQQDAIGRKRVFRLKVNRQKRDGVSQRVTSPGPKAYLLSFPSAACFFFLRVSEKTNFRHRTNHWVNAEKSQAPSGSTIQGVIPI